MYTLIQGIHFKQTWPDLYIADWQSQNNHTENRDQEITDKNINVNVINISVKMPMWTSIDDIQAAT